MLKLPSDLPRKYKYQLRVTLFAGVWRYSYELIGARGGLHFHVSGPHAYDGHDHYSAGLEIHSRTPLYDSDEAPAQNHCWLLECPCWHDGTTLYAEEHFLPVHMAGDYAAVFKMLAVDADDRFKIVCTEEAATS
jgi:hypothetical protein